MAWLVVLTEGEWAYSWVDGRDRGLSSFYFLFRNPAYRCGAVQTGGDGEGEVMKCALVRAEGKEEEGKEITTEKRERRDKRLSLLNGEMCSACISSFSFFAWSVLALAGFSCLLSPPFP